MPRALSTVMILIGVALHGSGCAGGDQTNEMAVGGSVRRPNILIYLVDTLRQDRLGCYGYPRPTSPNIDGFAAGASVFENAIGQSSWTRASMASIFTGVWPPTHGTTGWKHKLPETFDTLAERIDTVGYQTAAFVGNPQIVERYGFSQGFDTFVQEIGRPSPEYNRMAVEWLDSLEGREPWFIYIHTMDPHAPYGPPEPFMSEFAPNDDQIPYWEPRWKWPLEVLPFFSDRYDGEIAQNDSSFGQLLEILRRREFYDDTMIILTSDHGEEFKEHNEWRHGENLHAETLNVPLIVKFPRQTKGKRVERSVQHIDILPTILDYLGLEVPESVQGQSMLARRGAEDGIYSHLFLSGFPIYHSVVSGDWKLIRRIDEDGSTAYQLYHWVGDPGETTDLAAELPARVEALAKLLDAKLGADPESEVAEELPLTEEMQKELEALGYLQ